jgi:hypothetical protein
LAGGIIAAITITTTIAGGTTTITGIAIIIMVTGGTTITGGTIITITTGDIATTIIGSASTGHPGSPGQVTMGRPAIVQDASAFKDRQGAISGNTFRRSTARQR